MDNDERGYTQGFERIIFESRKEARDFLNKLRKYIDENDFLTIDEYYILGGKSKLKGSTTYGWMRLSNVHVYNDGDKFYLGMPAPIRKW